MNGVILCAALLSSGMPRAEQACEYTDLVVMASEQHNVDPVIYASLLYVESRWKKNAHGSSNECGLAQIVPKYTKKPKVTCKMLKNPVIAIFTGAKTLSYWVHIYGRGRYSTGLCGYNVGYRCKGKNKHPRGIKYTKHVKKWAKKIKIALKHINDES